MKTKSLLLLAALGLAGASAQAQVSLNAPGTYTQTFNGFTAFDASAHPMGWSTVHDGTGGNTYRGFTSDGSTLLIAGTSGGGLTSGGVFSWGQALAGPAAGDSTFAWQGTGSTPTMTTTLSFTNNTGAVIDELSVSFDVYQWRMGASSTGAQFGRTSTLDLSGSGNLTGLNAFNFTAAVQPTLSTPAVGRAYGDAAPPTFTADAAFNQTLTGLNLADGDSFSFTFTYDRGVGSGSAQGIAIDNFSLTAIPEPGTLALLLLGVGFIFRIARRRK